VIVDADSVSFLIERGSLVSERRTYGQKWFGVAFTLFEIKKKVCIRKLLQPTDSGGD
jgi:hypothetical protein